jgi:hypothetical protein
MAKKAPKKSKASAKPAKKIAPPKKVAKTTKVASKTATVKRVPPKPAPAPAKAVAKPAPKPVAAPPKAPPPKPVAAQPPKPVVKGPPPKAEPPPVDHNAALAPLFLGAGHGHLARTVDKSWLEAIRRYRDTLDKAIAYEAKRGPLARATMAINFTRQLQTLMNNLAARVQAIIVEVNNPELDAAVKDAARTGGQNLVSELQALNKSLATMVGPDGMAPHGDTSLPLGQPQTLEQLQRSYFNNIARSADLERSLS